LMNVEPIYFSLFIRVLLFVGDSNNHNLLQEGRPFIMRLQQQGLAIQSAAEGY
jgi:hypothetical protein